MNSLTLVTYPTQSVDHIATGKAARKIRTSMGLSLRKAALMMDVSAPYLSDLERGKRHWKMSVLRKFKLLKKA